MVDTPLAEYMIDGVVVRFSLQDASTVKDGEFKLFVEADIASSRTQDKFALNPQQKSDQIVFDLCYALEKSLEVPDELSAPGATTEWSPHARVIGFVWTKISDTAFLEATVKHVVDSVSAEREQKFVAALEEARSNPAEKRLIQTLQNRGHIFSAEDLALFTRAFEANSKQKG